MSFVNCKIIKADCSYDEYHRQDAKRGDKDFSMSRSELVEFALCPKRWIDGFGLDDDSTSATEWGSLIDCLVTGQEKFDSLFVVAPKMYPGAKGEEKPWTRQANYCKEWEAEHEEQGKTVIKSDVMEQAEIAVKAIKAHNPATDLLGCSQKQVLAVGFWKDKASEIEIPLRVLLDLVPSKDHPEFGKALGDFKTARNGNPETWARVVEDCSYDVQAALYFDLYCAASKEDKTDWVFIVQENVAPYHVVTPLPALSSEFMQYGRMKYQNALKRYAQCLATGVWPSYQVVGLPFGNVQLIGPDDLWNYRKTAGQGRIDR